MTLLELLGSLSLIAGSLFGLLGAVGLLRFPSFFHRIHPAGVTDTLCAGLIILGLALHADHWVTVAKLMMILFFLFFTTPTASHALAKAAVRAGLLPPSAEGRS